MKTGYSAKCLDGRFEESVRNVVNLPHEDPENMVAVIRFLYTGNVLSDNDDYTLDGLRDWGGQSNNASEASATLTTLIDLFIVADRYCIEDMCEKAVSLAATVVDQSQVKWCHLHRLKESGFHDSRLWRMLVTKVVKATEYGFNNLTELLEDGLQSDPDVATEILKSIADVSPFRCGCIGCGVTRARYCEVCLNRSHGWDCNH